MNRADGCSEPIELIHVPKFSLIVYQRVICGESYLPELGALCYWMIRIETFVHMHGKHIKATAIALQHPHISAEILWPNLQA